MLAREPGERLGEDELVFLAGDMASAGSETTHAQLPLILGTLVERVVRFERVAVAEGDPLQQALNH